MAEADKRLIREVLTRLSAGRNWTSHGSACPTRRNLRALETEAELDDYTFRVAGCVGEFWTRLCRAHLFPRAAVDEAMLLRDGIRFGKGLQLVNILRDIPADLEKGRCYIPRAVAGRGRPDAGGFALRRQRSRGFARFTKSCWTGRGTISQAGWNYTNALPRRAMARCAWPAPGRSCSGRERCGNCGARMCWTHPGASKSAAAKCAASWGGPLCFRFGPPRGRRSSGGKWARGNEFDFRAVLP